MKECNAGKYNTAKGSNVYSSKVVWCEFVTSKKEIKVVSSFLLECSSY